MRIFFLIFTTAMFLFFFVGCESGSESDLNKERKIDLIHPDSLESVDVSALKSRSNEIKLESLSSGFYNPISEQYVYSEPPSNEDIAIDNNQYERIKNILELNVIKHFELENKLDTDLKRKLFLESKEFKSKLNSLKEIQKNLLNRIFYFEWDPFTQKLEYDIYNQSFEFVKFESGASNDNYFTFTKLQFKLPENIKKTSTNHEYVEERDILDPLPAPMRTNTKQIISLVIPDERTALKIENNSQSIKLLFIFKVDSIRDFNLIYIHNYNILVFNSSTGEIYKTF